MHTNLFGHMVTKLPSGQENPNGAADEDADAADDQSNPYMSPSQAKQKMNVKRTAFVVLRFLELSRTVLS